MRRRMSIAAVDLPEAKAEGTAIRLSTWDLGLRTPLTRKDIYEDVG